MLLFSESLERDLSSDTIKFEIKVFANLPWSGSKNDKLGARQNFELHLKGIFLSFQKIIKILTHWINCTDIMCFNPKFRHDSDLSFFDLGPWADNNYWQIILSLQY